MINLALNFIAKNIQTYLGLQLGEIKDYILLGNVSNLDTGSDSSLQNKIILSVVNIEEDRIYRSPDNYSRIDRQVIYKNPPIYLNLDILFAANYTDYYTSLLLISNVIKFFQFQNVFTPLNSPN
ncbi:MAG: Pvc16 family protein, partial [Bacteroidales bacterium]